MVASGTRNARAISGVVRPPSSRSVSAARPSGESTGWQEMKTSRRPSSASDHTIITARGKGLFARLLARLDPLLEVLFLPPDVAARVAGRELLGLEDLA